MKKKSRRPAPDATVPVSVRMPLDVKVWLEKEGERLNVGYQSYMFVRLRELMGGPRPLDEERVREIIREELDKLAKG